MNVEAEDSFCKVSRLGSNRLGDWGLIFCCDRSGWQIGGLQRIRLNDGFILPIQLVVLNNNRGSLGPNTLHPSLFRWKQQHLAELEIK